ncbi:hypothetical protein [Janthinobacterium sp.]|uniref:hypothetical protein n=1 Tax=Janthinobacterium sp. TaxID=1871054 RepID=UPI00293D9483|nr:hypothetical protein [Janthinobacterium sp.]
MIHELPGTTLSKPDQGGKYDLEGMAAPTLHEPERWLTPTIGADHGSAAQKSEALLASRTENYVKKVCLCFLVRVC